MAAAIIPFIPAILAGAPGFVSAIGTVISNLVHKHQKEVVPVASPVAGTVTTEPVAGVVKKQGAMNDFVLIAGPLIEAIIKTETGKDVDVAALEIAVSGLIDDFVALNKALGIFQPPKPTT